MNTYWVNERSARGSSSSEGLRLSVSQQDSMFDLLKRTDSTGSMDSSEGLNKTRLDSGGKRRKSRKFSTLLSKTPIEKIGEENESMEFSSPDQNGSSGRRRSSRSDQSMRRSAQSDASIRRSGRSDGTLSRSGKSDGHPPEEALRALRKDLRKNTSSREPTPIGAAGEAHH